MRLRWPVWGGRATCRPVSSDIATRSKPSRRRKASRPRVARAAEAAWSAQHQLTGTESDTMARLWRARETGPLPLDGHRRGAEEAVAIVSQLWASRPAALLDAADATDVWTEVLRAWLAQMDGAPGATSAYSRVADERRAQAWQAIDSTLGELRAS